MSLQSRRYISPQQPYLRNYGLIKTIVRSKVPVFKLCGKPENLGLCFKGLLSRGRKISGLPQSLNFGTLDPWKVLLWPSDPPKRPSLECPPQTTEDQFYFSNL